MRPIFRRVGLRRAAVPVLKRSHRAWIAFALGAAVGFTPSCADPVPGAGRHENSTMVEPDSALPLVAHAGGGLLIDGDLIDYSNSRQALDAAYHCGHRLIEIDLVWSSDGRLVAAHDWNERLVQLFDTDPGRKSRTEFLQLESYFGLQQLDLPGLLRWLAENPDVRIVTDIKEDNLRGLALIRERSGKDQQRFIPQIYSTSEWRAVSRLGFRDVILTLYQARVADDDVVAFARRRHLFAVTMPIPRARSSLPARLAEDGVFTYSHTINSPETLRELQTVWKVGGVYTDILVPSDPGSTSGTCDLSLPEPG